MILKDFEKPVIYRAKENTEKIKRPLFTTTRESVKSFWTMQTPQGIKIDSDKTALAFFSRATAKTT